MKSGSRPRSECLLGPVLWMRLAGMRMGPGSRSLPSRSPARRAPEHWHCSLSGPENGISTELLDGCAFSLRPPSGSGSRSCETPSERLAASREY